MEQYRAGLVSTAIVARLRGRGLVHSVFRAAVNVEFQGDLVTVATPHMGALPNGVLLEGDTDLRTLGLAPVEENWCWHTGGRT